MSSGEQLHRQVLRALRAGVRGMLIETEEESRALGIVEEIGRTLEWPVHTWSAAGGIDGRGTPHPLAEVLRSCRQGREDELWVLCDALRLCDEPALRSLRELAQRVHGPAVVLLETPEVRTLRAIGLRIPELARLSLELPDLDELRARVLAVREALPEDWSGDRPTRPARWTDAHRSLEAGADALAQVGLGLATHLFERILAEGLLTVGTEPDELVKFVRAAKPRVVGDQALLQVVEPAPADALGGLPSLKAWMARRRLALDPQAAAAGVPLPRGCLLVGVQGCGKSLAARVCASELGLPLLRLEPGRLFGGTVGESEENLRRATIIADRLAPVVLWIDELDKGIAGSEGSNSDAGTAARVLGGLLTWLQERTKPVFVVATANRIDLLPPELLRRGRFDEIFFVDLPDAAEREAILRVHVERSVGDTQKPPALADPWARFAEVARQAEGYSGAELAAALAEARLQAFSEARAPTAADLRAALDDAIPLSVLRREEVAALQRWAETRARRA